MTRIETTFAALKQQNKKALIPYVMAGDPSPNSFVGLLHDLVEHGADMIEVGLPFSDPMADGPTVALAGERALAGGTSTLKALTMVKKFRETNDTTPIILMGYLNPIEIIGYDKFMNACQDAGVDGVLVVDLPPAESGDFVQRLAEHEMNKIFLLAPTTLPERRKQVMTYCGGYIYYVSLKGVTGSASLDTEAVGEQVQAIKQETDLPICVGFGIRDGKSAAAIGQYADGVIVGSELVKNFAGLDSDSSDEQIAAAQAKIMAKMDELRQALDSL
ncbi:tryptophan synthase subunit alpha [Psychrobacter sp. FDAARGOS_221]|uniref:tryptophan synthase subunit alpha n=1 Tax=Psychrobacter sp. FDAARGOS_221 TaxID=1975705 RepID=UPI000BB57AA8|nr:tryptophan synthase subunit alpha [Psychrobacter sp. FDAARGOS_221]PNK61501.1 tryptophan synthase subunit alpha [Psychrobacter sp. FDAARGOS_221]